MASAWQGLRALEASVGNGDCSSREVLLEREVDQILRFRFF